MDLSDAERDAVQAAEALAGVADHLAARGPDLGTGDRDVVMRALADEGSAAAERVVAYLRTLRGPGDGSATAVPTRLGPWRNWCPPRGHVLRESPVPRRRGDPGE
ncbi:MAG TPA: hypothetical protein VFO77_15280 [Actinoplanes sp.]|nr:hypothetical protein [Actinoplanes sp.]